MFFSFIDRINLTFSSISKKCYKLKWFLILLALLSFCGCGRERIKNIIQVDTGMGTVIRVSLYGTKECKDVCDSVFQMVDEMEQQEISWRYPESAVGRINLGNADIVIGKEFFDILLACQQISEDSEGAFDITIGKLSRLWDIDSYSGKENEKYELPTQEAVKKACEESGYQKLILKDSKVTLLSPAQMDLGAIGKGVALDRILSKIEEKKDVVQGAVISLGGSILTYGSKEDGTPWQVGIVDPFDTNQCIGVLKLTGQWCVSTSGDYQRFVEVDGVRYHHILNPRTGYPDNNGIRSVTILSKSGFLSDALSTACYVLGIDEGMKLAQKYQAEVLFVDSEGKQYMSEGMRKYFYLWNS